MHRIGRAGRFGDTGLALTLFDRESDEANFWEIAKHYKMEDKIQKLEGGAKQLRDLIGQAK
jgi:superfamily II DNA/RNA helicase